MKKLLLSLVALLATVGAWAQIAALSELNPTSSYTVKCVDRGFLYYDSNNGDYVTSSSHTSLVDATPTGEENQLFAFLRTNKTAEGNYYLFSKSANKFVTYKGTGVALELTDAPEHAWTVAANGEYFTIKVPETQQTYINITNWEAKFGCKVTSTAPDNGNKMTITEAADFDPTIALARINMHEGIFPVIGLGYPKASSDAYRDLVNAINGTDKDAYNTALAAYYNSNDVEMPQDGKAYTISAWWKTDGIWPMGWSAANSGTGATNGKAVYKPLKDNANPSAFVCKYVGGKYVFISDNGYFLSWENEPATGQTSEEYKDAHKFTLEKAVKTGNNIASELTDLDKFGKFSLKANNNHYLMFSSADNDYHNANAGDKYYGHTNANTVFFVLEEVPEYKTNIVNLSAQFEGETYISTFYAPYATVLPEGYTAHKATKVNTATVHLEEIGTEIPANTGVFVTGPANEKVVLSLSTSNPTSPKDNLLDGSAVDTYVAGPAYVLANGGNGVGLYKAELNKGANGEAGETHFLNNAGKAYLPVEDDAEARFLVFDFGGNETAIEGVEAETATDAVVYDLAGRRVKAAQKGLYIVNGKVVIK